jgi:hypothetical protein
MHRPSRKARRGRKRRPQRRRGHRYRVGVTHDPLVRARRVAYRRSRLAALVAVSVAGFDEWRA